jgi:hypothetical protein
MATVIQFRRDTAANWTSVNPILAQGEFGLETDTSQFKVGNGTSTWSALSYGGLVGPAQTNQLMPYGDGSDGNVSLSSGITTLTRNMFYNNLTLSGTAKIHTSGFKIYVKDTLDITAAAAGAINSEYCNYSNWSSGAYSICSWQCGSRHKWYCGCDGSSRCWSSSYCAYISYT